MKRFYFSFRRYASFFLITFAMLIMKGCAENQTSTDITALREGFTNPPDSARPGVYWYFMDGNLSKEGMTKDLEAMKKAGIAHVIYLEVNVGVPRGKTDLLSEEWKAMFKHAVEETERLGITITLGVGPGWTGSGGPWVTGEESMQHLVSSAASVSGPGKSKVKLDIPKAKDPYFGTWGFTPEVRKQWEDFYEDVAVLAFPSKAGEKIADTDQKALYYRAPYSSVVGVKQYLPTESSYPALERDSPVMQSEIIDLTRKLLPDGTLDWDVPDGSWTVMRFGVRNNGAVTRPAPLPGVGMEANKFDTTALNSHLDKFVGTLLDYVGPRDNSLQGGLKMLHMDSWEMGAQNWTPAFREEFTHRRGYDPLPYYPVYSGVIVDSREVSERFLWDLRLTSQQLIKENHAGHIRQYAKRRGYGLSIEPYDMNPTADLELASMADVPMCEYWSVGMGYNTAWSAVEGSSIAHLKGQPVVPAEAFTAAGDGWRQHPGSMKDQGDWAMASGINRLMYHTFQHQPLDDNLRPGMTMGPYGVHWDRNQTWWYMSDAYHQYIARSQFMLQQGRTVADILYLAPEGAPHVFRAPESALDTKVFADTKDINGGIFTLPDKRGYNFDACPPSMLYDASVNNGQIVFPSGATYRILVLPVYQTMTPGLLVKIKELLEAGATVMGTPPSKSPSLSGYPDCDEQIEQLATEIWDGYDPPLELTARKVGKGNMYWSKEMVENPDNLYPDYLQTSMVLKSQGLPEDFWNSTAGSVRYTHRTSGSYDIYFLSNRTAEAISAECVFRVSGMKPELWDPITGEMRALPQWRKHGGLTHIKMEFEPYESFFVVFPRKDALKPGMEENFWQKAEVKTLDGAWTVSFDPAWGGPAEIVFDSLTDWSRHRDEGIKYYSGTALYTKKFDFPANSGKLWLDLGKVSNMARVFVNGKNVGTVWTSPWQVDISDAVQPGENDLKIEVVNLWPNRLIGDQYMEDDGIKNGLWPDWLLKGEPRPGKRYTFTTHNHYSKESPLLESGLIGPVTILGKI